MNACTQRFSLFWFLSACLLAGCASNGPTYYVHPNADFSTIQRVAILPLDNFTTDRFASERVREVLAVEVLSYTPFDVVESGEVNRVLRERQIENISELGPEMVTSLGKDLNAQAIFMGSVMEYRERRSGTFTAPDIAINLRLVDSEAVVTVWSVVEARTGLGVWTRLFGVGEQSQTAAVRDLIREMLPTLFSS